MPSDRTKRKTKTETEADREPGRRRERRSRLWAAAGFTLGLLLVLTLAVWLASKRISSTEIELDLVVDHVEFNLSRQQLVAGGWLLAEMASENLRPVRLPWPADARLQAGLAPRTGSGPSMLWLAARPADDRGGTITVAPLVVPKCSRVALTLIGKKQYRLAVSAFEREQKHCTGWTPPTLMAGIDGALEFHLDGERQELELVKPQVLELSPTEEVLTLDMTLAEFHDGKPVNLAVQDLSFLRGVRIPTDRAISWKWQPGVLSGALYLKALDKEVNLRTGTSLNLTNPTGELRGLRLGDDRIELNYSGYVQGVSVGLDATHNLMPTLIEELYVAHPFKLALAALASAMTFLTSFIKVLSLLRRDRP